MIEVVGGIIREDVERLSKDGGSSAQDHQVAHGVREHRLHLLGPLTLDPEIGEQLVERAWEALGGKPVSHVLRT